MLIKVLVMLEGTAHQLSPQFSVAELIQPYATRAMRNRYSPKKILSRLKANAEDWEHLITILPRDTADILRNLKRGKFDVHLQHRRLEPVANRLVMGILIAALFMGSASFCSNHVRPTFFRFLCSRLSRMRHRSHDGIPNHACNPAFGAEVR